jgi:NAD(P)H dehydrogenase (quinone)
MATIAVTGASGKLGSATIGLLLKHKVTPASIIAIVRDPAKVMALAAQGVEIRRGDYTDPASLENALRGVDRLAFISSSALGDERVLHHGNLVKAAKLARVGHIFYTSVNKPAAQAKFAASPGHFFTEQLILDSGLTHTFFRNNLYMDLVPIMFGGAQATGTLAHNGGDGRIGFMRARISPRHSRPCSPPRVTRAAPIPSRRPGHTVSAISRQN